MADVPLLMVEDDANVVGIEGVDRFVRYASYIPAGAELGFHLCYGNQGQKHFIEPTDSGNLVRVANLMAAKIPRSLEWIHLPVPINRDDEAYFAPLADLKRAARKGKVRLDVPWSELTDDERPVFKRLQLITAKPMMYVLNVEEASAASGNAHSAKAEEFAKSRGMPSVVISAAIEAEVAQLPAEDQGEYLASLGLKETGLARVVRAGYALLDLVTFFTVGPKEARAWTVRREARAPEAAGVIHTDFEKGFIRAETIAFDDFVALRGEAKAREADKLRAEGKSYVVKDGDVMNFLFN